MNGRKSNFLGDWAAVVLNAPDGFARWHAQIERLRVGWQLDDAFHLVREAKRLSLPQPQHALVLHSEAMLYAQLGDWTNVVKRLMQAIDGLEDTPYIEEGMGLLLDLGMILRVQGNFAGAQAAHEQVLELAVEMEDVSFQAEASAQLGLTALHQENFPDAIARFTQALTFQQRIGNQVEQARIHNHLGDCYRRREEIALAAEHLQQALELLPPDDPNSHLRGQILGNLGSVAFAQDDLAAAEQLWRTALAIFDEIGATFDKAGLLNNLGGLALQQERYDEAIVLLRESLALAEELGDERGQQEARMNLVLAVARRENIDLAALAAQPE